MRTVAGLLAVPILASAGWAQVPPAGVLRVSGAADYGDGATTGIPRGSIFTITGLNLAGIPPSVFSAPLPVAFRGLSVGIWDAPAGASARLLAQAPLLYVSPTQINAILPSSIAAGQYSLRVAVASPTLTQQMAVAVTDGRFAAFTRAGRGFGPAAVQQYDAPGNLSLNGLTTPAVPGAVMTLWGTGLGALASGADADSPQAGMLRSDVTIYVAGIPVTPLYAGRAPGIPGVDQVNFFLPPGIAPGCFVPLQVQTGEAWSNIVTLAVSASGTTCGNDLALDPAMLARLDAGGKLRGARFFFTSSTASPGGTVTQTAQTYSGSYDASDLSVLVNPVSAHPLPQCSRSDQASTGTIIIEDPGPVPEITGVSGCQWRSSYPGCVASGFSFGPELAGFSGTLPRPRQAGEITNLTAVYAGQQLTAWWSATPGPADGLSVAASSSYTDPSLFGADPVRTYTNTLSCRASSGATSFAFPGADIAWALQYSSPSVGLTLANATDQSFNLTGTPYDFLLVQAIGSVTAKAAISK